MLGWIFGPLAGMIMSMSFMVDVEREEDGRWIAEIATLPGVMAYGTTRDEAINHAVALAYRVLAERVEHGEVAAAPMHLDFTALA